MSSSHKGACFCGAVEIEVTGDAVAVGFCHCGSCRSWSASPVNGFTLFKADEVRVTKGADLVGTYNKTDNSYRKFCQTCGGHLMNAHPGFGLVDVYAATIPTHQFTPALHVFYDEKVLAIHDGLPKFKDMPSDFGGSGEMLAE